MELVRGIKITDYCDKNNLSTEERLKLFILVCSAIQHAHQKGIIHRDIKPSNILVTLHDGVPVPKVIDFGIAKATSDQRLTDKTVYTAFEQFIGTPAYMSPEQAEMSGLDIDTRSDIYSLGVLLYELLTGKTPFDAVTLLQAGLDRMRQMIREQEPQRPSTRLGTLEDDDLTAVANHRSAEVPRLLNLIRGDLDWIVMKSLEKDRTRRYETANGLGMDLQRHLRNEPVAARPPSTAYKLQKAWRRNKLVFTAVTAVAASLVLLVILSVYLIREFQAGKYGGVEIETFPKGAEVWLNGSPIGTTPYQASRVSPGVFTYTLKLPNYQLLQTTIAVRPRRTKEFVAFMSPTNLKAANTTNVIATPPVSFGANIVELQGIVEVSIKRNTNWLQAFPNMVLSPGSRLRIGRSGRATLNFSDQSVVSFGELTELEILEPGQAGSVEGIRLIKGIISFFHKDSPGRIRVITRGAIAGIEG
jgi:serine/threonine protein kinase